MSIFASKKYKKEKSFTIIEILIVMAIIVIVVAIVAVSVGNSREKANIAAGFQFSSSVKSMVGDELMGEWFFNEGSGSTARDSSGYNNNGTISGASYTNDTPHKIVGSGSGKYALSFNGVNNVVTFGDKFDQTGSFTLEAWIYPKDIGYAHRIIIKDTGFTFAGGWALSLGDPGAGKLRFYIRETSPMITDTGAVISANKWYHVVGVWNFGAGIRYIYVNGIERARTTGISGTTLDNNEQFGIGCGLKNGKPSSNLAPFNGYIDEVRIYSQALNAVQIQQRYAEGVKKKGLIVKE